MLTLSINAATGAGLGQVGGPGQQRVLRGDAQAGAARIRRIPPLVSLAPLFSRSFIRMSSLHMPPSTAVRIFHRFEACIQ